MQHEQKNLIDAKNLVEGNWLFLMQAAGASTLTLSGKHTSCPICGGSDRFRWMGEGSKRGFLYYCNNLKDCGPRRDGFQMLMSLLNCDFKQACEFVRQQLGVTTADSPIPPKRTVVQEKVLSESDVQTRRAKYKLTWDQSKAITPSDPVGLYLAKRVPGLPNIPKVLRYHRGLDFYEKNDQGVTVKVGTFPAKVAVIQGPDGRVCNINRTYLTRDGYPAPVTDGKNKKLMQSIDVVGGACRLFEPVDTLGIAEGIETALAAFLFRKYPTWATLSTWGMESFILPPDYDRVKNIIIFADNDGVKQNGSRPGLDAARKLADRLIAQGLKVTIEKMARSGTDFADLYHQRKQK
ncbi:toprim domain-containing protein [Limnobacter alexandrii]|uniref:toprim domain-containing protein n=1 Tax=Limnobacter alexandrii TaxID=2570352 RepID=UPI0011091B83|nr:toprim domain-containing protein [Limnobacter alexandrii]